MSKATTINIKLKCSMNEGLIASTHGETTTLIR